MSNKDTYTIPIKGLELGKHEYTFVLDNEFFEGNEETKEFKGSLKAKVLLVKSELLLSLNISVNGDLEVICDRCLDSFIMPFYGNTEMFVKFGEENEELADNLLVIPINETVLKMSDLFYELFLLNLPLQMIHPEVDGESTCNKEMMETLNCYSVDPEENIDPRWAELKKLINN